ncbi:hypothetical protein COT44_00340 [Candidatus Shapirobacteria bacterium CG08_land_8_20_14_0_20_39_18]|uniref:DUF11 domain-containing protein n=1 Tax=Candidatus Shapirobacteria bacterium CG08_land_8_20_14_0_20_39_18 TaxID=1974883 RepID=A0A2M6XE84_9BACT|nr:MAG: hypothetical protein COT44_00340 [Candidatus Shapirobacteria bacterium CG08_land_8_20_14_0_20_39_18]PIY64716.1 MAG: hypothetical protein COY91_04580 [Candidatus Shapirobacteria bacterium CG_4_10_14_0_8_um_filter_39_15]PJE68668.1 MAG: hypothetical protein COU94_00795 [Candidatus Shapirobacteria bacterium CG10_big_fil_rev_8_21_14_0_10_38_8]
MKYLIKFFGLITALMVFVLLAKPVKATTVCETQYGGGETCKEVNLILVDKKVFNPDQAKFVDNLGINDLKFASGDEIRFKVIVKNISDVTLTNIKVTDILPDKLYFVDGPVSWNDREMIFTIDNLNAGESKESEIRAKVVPAAQLPANEILCRTNFAKGEVNGQSDQDTSQACFENKVLAQTTPVTGPSILPLAFLVSLMIVGLILNKKTAL